MLIGHERNKAMFEKMHTGGNVPHAFLLAGPAGVGKKDFALWCADTLLNASAQNHPDAFMLDAPSIDEVRSLNQTVGTTSFGRGARVVVIENAHAMNAHATNALLKTLEEPRSNTIFFLLCEHKEQVISTIQSRCVSFYFGFVDISTIQKSLDTSEIMDIQELWEGRPSYARAFIDNGSKAQELVRDLRVFLQHDIGACFSLIEKYTQDKQEYETFLSGLIAFYRSNEQWRKTRALLSIFYAFKQSNAHIAWMMRNFVIQEHTL